MNVVICLPFSRRRRGSRFYIQGKDGAQAIHQPGLPGSDRPYLTF
jgi:hypothetical protein